jgi:hypothetical protein
MDAAAVRDSQILLERMAEMPDAVLEGLDRTELGTKSPAGSSDRS